MKRTASCACPILELDSSRSVTPGVYGIEAKAQSVGSDGAPEYVCPARIDNELMKKLHHFAYRAHVVLGSLDVSRTDFRLDAEGNPRLIEINTLPGLTPGYSDLCIQCDAQGIPYTDLILEILYLGASRFGLIPPRNIPLQPAIKAKTAPLPDPPPCHQPRMERPPCCSSCRCWTHSSKTSPTSQPAAGSNTTLQKASVATTPTSQTPPAVKPSAPPPGAATGQPAQADKPAEKKTTR